ncbi:MAG: diguanylate cyclase [Gammaproteobacteria bacterium]|nr:diguanylate cyclase [Gammaproteobacteria bacterium]
MTLPYTEKFGFDAKRIRERLQWLQLTAQDHALARRLRETVLLPCGDDIVATFYDWLLTIDASRPLLGNDDFIRRLKQTQKAYLLELGHDFDQPHYFESRLRVGQAHVWVGLSLSLYQCAYRRLTQLILDLAKPEDAPLRAFINKITALDMSLAIETYHLTQVQALEDSLSRSRQLQDHLRQKAFSDSLTGLANHQAIHRQLQQMLTEGDKDVAVVMVDIDHFKAINDQHGHPVGDKVLVEVTRRLRAALRDFDFLGRYGGEEFLLVLTRASLATATQVAERTHRGRAGEPARARSARRHQLGGQYRPQERHGGNTGGAGR